VSLINIDPITDARWLTLVNKRSSTVFHAPAWLMVLSDTYGFDIRAQVVIDESGQARAGLVYAHVHDLLGKRIVSLPFSDYTDPIVDNPDDWEQLVQPLIASGQALSVRTLHNAVPLSDPRFTLVKRARWHRIDVRCCTEAIWQKLDDATHRTIRQAIRDVRAEPDNSPDAIQRFYQMHLSVRKRKYKMLAQPARFFQNIYTHWIDPSSGNGDGTVILARHGAEVVAAAVVLRWQDTLYYKFSASASEHLCARPNDLLVWALIQYAQQIGCDWIDYGLSDWNQEGLIRFKRKYATEEGVISFLRHTSPHEPPVAGEGEPAARQMFNSLTELLTDPSVPDAITERAGNLLYRYFV